MTPLDRLGRGLLPAAFFLALIVALGFALGPSGPPSSGNGDKVQHFLAFYALTLLGAAAYPRPRALIVLALGLSAYGGLIEIVQPLSPFARSRDVMDWVADDIGILFAALPILLGDWRSWRRAKAQ